VVLVDQVIQLQEEVELVEEQVDQEVQEVELHHLMLVEVQHLQDQEVQEIHLQFHHHKVIQEDLLMVMDQTLVMQENLVAVEEQLLQV
jgi:hypothetical protein